MVDRYYREIEDVKNDIENTIQISSILLKLKGYDNELSKIGNNTNNISTNLEKIDDNLEKINDIKSLLPKSEIFKKTYSIKYQSFRFTRNIVYFKLLEIEIENNFNKDGKLEFDNYIYYKYDNLQRDHHRLQHEYRIFDNQNNLLYKKILNKTNTSDLDFDKNIMLVKDNFYVTFKNNYNKIKIILDLFRVFRHGTGNFNLELINESFVNITYLDKNDISLKIEDNENNISSNLSKIGSNKDDITSNLSKIGSNKDDITSNLSKIGSNKDDITSNLSKISDNSSDISSNSSKIGSNKDDITSNLSKINNNSSEISTNSDQISTNKNDISTNLIKITSNEDDILYNLNEINYLKNNSSKSYLKNVYNILFYDRKTQVSFKNYFFERVFDINSNIHDFIEMSFKISLEYENISERSYVKTLYELFDENDNSLYIKSVNNNDYSYYSNKIFIDESIFYNFTKSIKKIKFVIKFQMILSRVIKIWYIKNDNYRLVIKNYGV